MPEATNKSFQQKCESFFKECNNGDPITPGQLARVIRQAVPSFQGSDAEIAEMFRSVDKDKNALISWEEFSTALFAKDIREVTRAELEEEFKKFDADGSGKLSREEVKGIMEKLGIKFTDEGLDETMQEADPNGDGVDIKEFLALFKDLKHMK